VEEIYKILSSQHDWLRILLRKDGVVPYYFIKYTTHN